MAEEIAQAMVDEGHQYYPALLSGYMVWVAPVPISREEALAIMMLNSSRVGVFAVSSSYARGLCKSLGGAKGPEIHDTGSGYWFHYHGKSFLKAHCWFIG